MKDRKAQTQFKINELIANRWSPHVFDPDKQISKTDILTIIEAAGWAPSAKNRQPYGIIVCDKFTNPEAYNKAFQSLSDSNKEWAGSAPIYFIMVAKKEYLENDELYLTPFYDTGAAAEHLCLQALELNIYTRQMAKFDKDYIIKEFNIPDGWLPITIIAAGYLGNYQKADKTFLEKDETPRSRKPLNEIAFDGKWGNPISI
ncbi:MAG TPA: nitroreductase family protein [Bacteroidota bacterium]|nr:nitroreductase family protein [Candidatus Kapabacteria bacterium]HRS01219.1 nitroreductase family protein [Bacteroidota bacterium]